MKKKSLSMKKLYILWSKYLLDAQKEGKSLEWLETRKVTIHEFLDFIWKNKD